MELLLGFCDVDSGQVLICDPCYIKSKTEPDDEYNHCWNEDFDREKMSQYEKDGKPKLDYSGCCAVTLDSEGGGQLYHAMGHPGAGVASSTGWGDGSYPVYAERKDGRIVALHIYFDGRDEGECDEV